MFLLIAKRHLVILYTRYTTRFSLRSNLVAPLEKMPKVLHFGEFLKPEACGQTVLLDRSVVIGQKLVETAKIKMRHFE